jgi:hypothetical protein
VKRFSSKQSSGNFQVKLSTKQYWVGFPGRMKCTRTPCLKAQASGARLVRSEALSITIT